jgi:hypothetical protein
MENKFDLVKNQNSRILILSLRNVRDYIFNYSLFEFEDLITAFDRVDLVAPCQYTFTSQTITNIAKAGSKINKIFTKINPYILPLNPEKEYDLFFVILDDVRSFLPINFINNWAKKCRKKICLIAEIWEKEPQQLKSYLRFFEEFDRIYLGCALITKEFSQTISKPCYYLPAGTDTVKFYPNKPYSQRAIDIFSLGRRSALTHQALLQFTAEYDLFYYYDTFANYGSKLMKPSNIEGHRRKIANLIKNSRYFIANYAKVNLPNTIGTQKEIGYRFFEGAAAGAVMIGSPPESQLLNQYFDWEDALIPINFDQPNIANLITELNAQSDRLEKISKNNVINSLLKHDWVYRWEQILTDVGLEPTPMMLSRQEHLQQLAILME